MVTVTTPPQLSVAVGAVKLVTSHCAVTSANVARSATGAVVSVITTSCVWVDVFPLLPVYVHVIVNVPNVLYTNGSDVVPLMITPAHPSVAVGITFTVTLHSPVTSGRFDTTGAGTPVSWIITFWI